MGRTLKKVLFMIFKQVKIEISPRFRLLRFLENSVKRCHDKSA